MAPLNSLGQDDQNKVQHDHIGHVMLLVLALALGDVQEYSILQILKISCLTHHVGIVSWLDQIACMNEVGCSCCNACI